MARFVGLVALAGRQVHCPRMVRLVQSNFSLVCMYTTRVHILYARAMIERPLGKRSRQPPFVIERRNCFRGFYTTTFSQRRSSIRINVPDRRDDHSKKPLPFETHDKGG